jgi:ABC-type sugar transport system substrate-binding protein
MINQRSMFGRATVLAATGLLALAAAAGCGKKETPAAGGTKTITLGFSQVGSESGWRSANTKSVKDAAAAAGINLKFSDAQQKQENQIQAIRDYISQKVDVISFSPVVTTGWDTVLKEAQAAKIPVILTDRQVDSDPSLFVTLVGSDFEAEGERAAHLLEKVLQAAGNPSPVNIAVLEGTTGSAPAIERAKGFKKVMDASDPSWKIVVSQTGDFTRDGGKQVMAAFLQSHPEINVLFAHNDDMGIGAIQSIEAAGKKPGTDIRIVTIDGVHDGFVAMTQGKINAIAECNPLLGPQLMETIKTVLNHGTVDKWIKTKESDFMAADAGAALPNRQY